MSCKASLLRSSYKLSSFQESVAMDRIHRILGVLRNPNMGERFLSTLLQIEKMLQSWFPHVKPRPSVIQSERSTPAKRQKRHHTSATLPLSSGPSLSTSPPSSRASSGPYSATILKWLHTSPICSPKTAGQGQPTTTTTTTTTPPSGCEPGATQDSVVSSSTDVSTRGRRSSHRRHGRLLAPPLAPPFKLRSPCLERLLQAKGSVMSRRMAQEEEEEEEEPGSRRQAICTPPDSKHGQRQRSLRYSMARSTYSFRLEKVSGMLLPPGMMGTILPSSTVQLKAKETHCFPLDVDWCTRTLLEKSFILIETDSGNRANVDSTTPHPINSGPRHSSPAPSWYCCRPHLVEVVLGDAAVLDVQDGVERLHVEQVHLLQVLQQQGDAAQLFPHHGRQVQVQGLLGADGHAHQDAQELELQQVFIQTRRGAQ
ncbi:hypothetical protein CRUP_034366 [Coryphaenoides rupestris]|nr:hypothetical protein CRUP_034366 [Coryphaenoides rupestris]